MTMPDELMTRVRDLLDDGAAPITLEEVSSRALVTPAKRPRRRAPLVAAGVAAVAAILAVVAIGPFRGSSPHVVTPRDTVPPPASVPPCAPDDAVVPCELPGVLGIKETPTIDAAAGDDALGSWQATMYQTSKAIDLTVVRNGDPRTTSGYGGGLPSETPMSSGWSINGTVSGIVRGDIAMVRITWPDGSIQDVTPLPVKQLGVGIYVLGRTDRARPAQIIGLAADGSVVDTIP